MSELDAVEYKNGQKNHWRRTMWNRVERIVPNRRDAVVLYLPGSRDLDADEAIRRGFRSANLIAVERSQEIAKELRKSKRTVVCGDIGDVLMNWPADVPVAAVIADLQSNLSSLTWDVMGNWIAHPAFRYGVLMLNMQRGRESPSDQKWSFLRDPSKHFTSPFSKWREVNPLRWAHVDDRNRACLLMAGLFNLATCSNLRELGYKNDVPMASVPLSIREEAVAKGMASFGVDVLPSYRSTPQSPLFDSLLIRDLGLKFRCLPPIDMRDEKMRQKISAALAVRTMRLNGQLKAA